MSSQRNCVMKSVKALRDWNLISADWDSTFFTIAGSKVSIISFEFYRRSFEFFAIVSKIINKQVLNSSIDLFPGSSSQLSNKYPSTWIKFCLQIFDLKLLELIISYIGSIISKGPLRFWNYFLFLIWTFFIPFDL